MTSRNEQTMREFCSDLVYSFDEADLEDDIVEFDGDHDDVSRYVTSLSQEGKSALRSTHKSMTDLWEAGLFRCTPEFSSEVYEREYHFLRTIIVDHNYFKALYFLKMLYGGRTQLLTCMLGYVSTRSRGTDEHLTLLCMAFLHAPQFDWNSVLRGEEKEELQRHRLFTPL
jgi:hypothetical protein